MKDREFFKLGVILGNVLAAVVLKLKGGNDSPVIKNFFKGFQVVENLSN